MQDTLKLITDVIRTQVKIEQRNQYLKKTVVRLRRDLSLLKKQYSAMHKEFAEIRRRIDDTIPSPKQTEPTFTPASIVRLRKKLDITEVELALLIEVTAVTISRWENARSPIRLSNRMKIAELRTLGRREVRKRLVEIRGTPR